MKNSNNIWKKRLFILLGTISLILGIIGIVLPLLPTTPFLLLTAYFYAKGSERLYKKLLSNSLFGTYIQNFREGKGITTRSKIVSILSIWVAIAISLYFFTGSIIVKAVLISVASAVSYYLVSLKSLKED